MSQLENARTALTERLTALENTPEQVEQAEQVIEQPPAQTEQAVQTEQTTPQQAQQQIDPQALAMAAIQAQQRENQQLRAQIQQLQQLQQETQQANEQAVMQTLQAPVFPQMEYDSASDEERQSITERYSRDLETYYTGLAERTVNDRIKPMEEYYKTQSQQAEENNIINGMERSGNFPDVQELMPEIRKVIANIPDFQKLPLQSRIPLAYYALKGHKGAAPAQQENDEQLLEKVKKSPGVLKALKAEEVMTAKNNSEIPQHITSGAVSNAAAAMPTQPPKRLEDVRDHVMKTRFTNKE